MNIWGHEEHRIVDNLAQHYDAWRQARIEMGDGHLQWKRSRGNEYLYRIMDGSGNGVSLGVRDKKTEVTYEVHRLARHTERRCWILLHQDAAIYRALKLPRITPYAADILRELDVCGWLDGGVLAVGTTAMAAYELEAGATFTSGLDSTDDFDMTWRGSPPIGNMGLLAVIKKVDPTYTVNTERTFQARNSNGYEFELLLASALDKDYPNNETLRPVPLIEQDWLLMGKPLSQVVIGTNQKPCRIVVPDPRYFALQKLWLSEKPQRKATKKGKDREQGLLLLEAITKFMPHYPMGGKFVKTLPAPLAEQFQKWKSNGNEISRKSKGARGPRRRRDVDDPLGKQAKRRSFFR
jgi:hypothetical protein